MASERVLIIEDSKQMLLFLADKALPALGYQPIVAETGRKGLRLVESETPDLILLDLNLPDMTGIEVLRQLSAADSRAPVILMTAYGTEQVMLEAFRMGVRDYLTKPLELGELADAIKRALETPRLQRDRRRLAEDLHATALQLRQQLDRIAAFTHIGRAVTASLDLDSILTQVIEAGTHVCDAEEATVWLLEGLAGELVMVAETGMDPNAINLQRRSTIMVQDALAGEAVRTREPVQASDFEAGIKVKTGYLVKAVLYVPLLIQNRCLGVLSVANRNSLRSFSESDVKSLQILADYAAIAIEKAHLYQATDEALQRRTGELAAITEISEAVATLDFELLLRRSIDRVHQTFSVEAVGLYLVDRARESLALARASDQTIERSGRRVLYGQGLVGCCARDGQSYMTNDPLNHPLFSPEADQLSTRAAESLLVVPLAIEGRLIGVVELVNKHAGPFREDDASLLKAMAMPVAAAVDNLRLFGQTVRERATLHAVVNGSTRPILIVNRSHELLLWNPAATKLFGIPAGRAPGLSLSQATGLPRLIELVDKQQAVSEEIRFSSQTYIANVSPIEGVGSAIEMQDITYLKELDKAKSEFVTMVSHDLRSPLTSIVGFTELLPAAGPLNEKQQEFVKYAIEATRNMRRLIDDLLDLAKIESGISAAQVPCDLNKIVADVVTDSQGIAVAQGIELSTAERTKSATVLGDPGQLERALANLIANALKYTPTGGQVRVDLRSSDNTLYVTVADTGHGIPEKDLPHIFEKFYRVDANHRAEGTGLGLAMVKSIVRAHNGRVSVRSEEGKGSTFTMALPLT